ncbi:MAG: hypothetical protein Q7U74_08765 [Saprospiraceae bacterium]|nr:hypothetical protein [Saprospiraceae bacterium]
MGMFGRPGLNGVSILEAFEITQLFWELHQKGVIFSNVEELSDNVVIEYLIEIRPRKPKSWILLYILGDRLLRNKQYAKAVEVLEAARLLRPKDPRSTFALASAYRKLSRAQFLGINLQDLFPSDTAILSEFDPEASHKEILKIGMSVDEAALKSMELFEETLSIGVRGSDRRFVQECLQKMYADFPHLEIQIKNKRSPNTSLLQDARKGSGGVLNEAIEHFTRLRFLMDTPPRYRFELGEVIRLCQWSIAADNRQGDAYVLLANAYSLLDSQTKTTASEPHFYMCWAGAIIQHWNDTPLRQYPFTKNGKIGDQLYEMIIDHFITVNQSSRSDVISEIKEWAKDVLQQALSPATYEKIKEQLERESL